jgi:sensor histidine kinase YesM
MIIGGIKYTKSTIRNHSIIQKSCSSFIGFKMVIDEQQTGFKNVGFLKTSQLHKCGFAYIWYPLMNERWRKNDFQAFLYQLWSSPNLHWKQKKISISDGFGHTLKIGKFLVFIFFIFFSFLSHAILPILISIYFFGRLLKILKHCQLIWKNM